LLAAPFFYASYILGLGRFFETNQAVRQCLVEKGLRRVVYLEKSPLLRWGAGGSFRFHSKKGKPAMGGVATKEPQGLCLGGRPRVGAHLFSLLPV